MRKTKRFAMMLLMVAAVLGGCGNKSKEELTDIEQFCCQDSIQTVFNVLGEAELKTKMLGGEYYKYEGLNLFGYEGEVVFNVRGNKETIQDFCCYLVLSKKEFEDILYQISEKYGKYQSEEFIGDIIYTWVVPDDKEMGYTEITAVQYEDKKYSFSFSDEWSNKKDEAYYQHLEEEKEVTTLAEKTYNIGEDTFNFSFGQRGNGEYSFILLCNIENKADAYVTHISLNALFDSDEEAIKALTGTMNFSYTIIMGDKTVLLRTKGLLYLSKGGEIIDVNDYFPVEWVLEENVTKSDYGTQVTNFLVDFIENE